MAQIWQALCSPSARKEENADTAGELICLQLRQSCISSAWWITRAVSGSIMAMKDPP